MVLFGEPRRVGRLRPHHARGAGRFRRPPLPRVEPNPGSPVKLRAEGHQGFRGTHARGREESPRRETAAVWLPHTVLGISTPARSRISPAEVWPVCRPALRRRPGAEQDFARVPRADRRRLAGARRSRFARALVRHHPHRARRGRRAFRQRDRARRGAVGPKQQGLERRLECGRADAVRGSRVRAQADGFTLVFTTPVDRATAGNPASYSIGGFTISITKPTAARR